MENIVPISELQTKAKRYVELVRESREPLIITQRGRAAVVLAPYEEYLGHQETQDEMSYPDWRKRLTRARKESQANRGMTLDAYLKKRRM